MKLKLYDGKKVGFKKNMTLEEIEDKIETEIFSVPKYQMYYGFVGEDGSSEAEIRNDVNYTEARWIGVKPVKKDRIETVKNTLDILSYIYLTHNNLSTGREIAEYKKLKNKKELSIKEKEKLLLLDDSVFYNKNNSFMFVNKNEEDRLFKINDHHKIKEIQFVKNEILNLDDVLTSYMNQLNQNINDVVEVEAEHREYLFSEIARLKKEIYITKLEIENLIEEYYYLTETKVSIIR